MTVSRRTVFNNFKDLFRGNDFGFFLVKKRGGTSA